MTSVLSFLAALALTLIATPCAIALAHRTGFYDQPKGYKRHVRPTPYLGGLAVIVSFLVVALTVSGADRRFMTAFAAAGALLVIGTIDDRVLVSPQLRLIAEAAIAVFLYESGLGWFATGQELVDLPLTIIWVVGLTNAFNLMDNMDGAASTVGGVSAAGIGALALAEGRLGLAAVAFALSGTCVGFLCDNLARPARIFLGDGGSMPLGMLIATIAMSACDRVGLGSSAPLAGGLLVGLPILDTTLVSISRWRRQVSLLTGGRDHLTHRILLRAGSPRKVACRLALLQALLCVAGIVGARLGIGAVRGIAGTAVLVGVAAIARLDSPAWRPAGIATAEGEARLSHALRVPPKLDSRTLDHS